MVKRATLLILLAGCGGPAPQTQPVASSTAVASPGKAPFEYKVIETDETRHFMGPQTVLLVETTNDVAKKSTEDDLLQFWRTIEPTIGADRRVFIRLKTPVPGAMPWGLIRRLKNFDGKWEFKVEKNDFGVDAEPYYFVDKIDRSKQNQAAMILTLPVVNRIVERLIQSGWSQAHRNETLVKLEKPAKGLESFNVTLTPESITLDAWHKDDAAIFDAIELLTKESGISNEIKRKMQSVIGSPEYYRGNREGRTRYSMWNWTIRDYDVMYTHDERGNKQSIDSVSIDHHSE